MSTKRHHYIMIIMLAFTISSSTVKALTIDVQLNPETIAPGTSTTITVKSDSEGKGKITVKPPAGGGPATSVDISFPAGGGSVSKIYPDNFGPKASTDTLGEYEVHVVVHDHSAAKSFWVSFEVVPISPIGSIGLLLTLLTAFGTYALTKRKVVSLR